MSKRGPYLLDVNTREMPGKVRLVFATFETRFMSVSAFRKGPEKYHLLDQTSPEAQLLRELLLGGDAEDGK